MEVDGVVEYAVEEMEDDDIEKELELLRQQEAEEKEKKHKRCKSSEDVPVVMVLPPENGLRSVDLDEIRSKDQIEDD